MFTKGKKYIVQARIVWSDSRYYDAVCGECEILGENQEYQTQEKTIRVSGEKGEVILDMGYISSISQSNEEMKVSHYTEEEKEKTKHNLRDYISNTLIL